MATFLRLSDENTPLASTRGQHLPALIQSRSSASLAGMRTRWSRMNSIAETPNQSSRRRSYDWHEGEEEEDDDDEEEQWRQSVQHSVAGWGGGDDQTRRMSYAASVLMTPQVRSQRLIGNNNPRYKWERYWKSEEELKAIKNKSVRKYYERNNYLIQHYMYIDRLLDSSLPHDLIQEYQSSETSKQQRPPMSRSLSDPSDAAAPPQANGYGTLGTAGTVGDELHDIQEEESGEYLSTPPRPYPDRHGSFDSIDEFFPPVNEPPPKVKRTPKELYSIKNRPNGVRAQAERLPLLSKVNTRDTARGGDEESGPMPPDLEVEDEADSQSPVVTAAIIINLIANTALLIMKIVVVVLSSSVSVLASLVDAALDFLSTAIVGLTTLLISRTDQYAYPIGRRRLEPVGVLVFSVIMITAFLQVLSQAFLGLTSGEHKVVELTVPAIVIMASTVVIKFACWLWCRLIKNSSVQALAQDAMTDVVFNIFSIIFPLVGFYAKAWWLDPLGGVFLSLYVIINWSTTANEHIRNLTGASATADERNILLYLTMRFAKTIKGIQGLQAYHSGDKLNVEVDVVLDEATSLRDSHDLGESLQYVLESVPSVDRAFVHMDYSDYNLPSHMQQDS